MMKRTAADLSDDSVGPLSKRSLVSEDQETDSASLLIQRVEEFLPRIKQSGLSLGSAQIVDPEIVDECDDDLKEPLIEEYESDHGEESDEGDTTDEEEDDDDSDFEISSEEHVDIDEDDQDLLSTDDEIDHKRSIGGEDSEDEDSDVGDLLDITDPMYERDTNEAYDHHIEMNIGIGMFEVENSEFSFDANSIAIPVHESHAVGEIIAGDADGSYSWLLHRNLDDDF